MSESSILVTGAAGFTGRHLISVAREAGYRCIAMCRDPSESVPHADECVYSDLLDRSALFEAVKSAEPAMVVHLAAISFVAHEHMEDVYRVNLLGSLNLLDAVSSKAPGIKKILMASSANIYGNISSLPITEKMLPEPLNHYGVSKYAMEMAAELYTSIPIVTVRPFNYTGVGQTKNFLIPKLVDAFKKRLESISLGNVNVARDFSDVRDVVSAYLKLLEEASPHSTYNVCSGRSTTLLSVMEMLEKITNHRMTIVQDPNLKRENEILDLYGSCSLLEATIGQFRKYRLQDTLAWMIKNQDMN